MNKDDNSASVMNALNACNMDCLIARVSAKTPRDSVILEGAGFRLMDVRIHLDLNLSTFRVHAVHSESKIRLFQARYAVAIRRIARNAFRTDHFHVDPRFNRRKVDDMYSLWVDRCLNEGYALKVATLGNIPVGFIAARGMKGIFYIELVAVAREFRGRGVGHDLVVDSLIDAATRFSRAEIGVQLSNTAAIRLYERIGFKVNSCECTFHWWRR